MDWNKTVPTSEKQKKIFREPGWNTSLSQRSPATSIVLSTIMEQPLLPHHSASLRRKNQLNAPLHWTVASIMVFAASALLLITCTSRALFVNTLLHAEDERIQLGAFDVCISSHTLGINECHRLAGDCRVTLSAGDIVQFKVPIIDRCAQYHAGQAFLIISTVLTCMATAMMVFTVGCISSKGLSTASYLSRGTGITAGVMGLVAMALYASLHNEESTPVLSDSQLGWAFWTLVGSWPLTLIASLLYCFE